MSSLFGKPCQSISQCQCWRPKVSDQNRAPLAFWRPISKHTVKKVSDQNRAPLPLWRPISKHALQISAMDGLELRLARGFFCLGPSTKNHRIYLAHPRICSCLVDPKIQAPPPRIAGGRKADGLWVAR